ncbi:MAG: CCA tRNA nucleotidyltransferase [Alphaproteobacteria bacterium]|nr:CCA tRNA nucleotidyltransferase [Alphaproteobacteria bacterium]MBL0717666.1 CCA tRNA nucleotidyltransferase [Alphaproteobacteria bacterium]
MIKLDWKNCDFLKPYLNGIIELFETFDSVDKELFFVGGFVRDLYKSSLITSSSKGKFNKIVDLDFSTEINHDAVGKILKTKFEIKTVGKGEQHGTWGVLIPDDRSDSNLWVEITSFRKDTITNGRHSNTEHTNSIHEDASRRDFTMNALYMRQNGEVIDPLKTGIDDLSKGVIKFIGSPLERLEEDGLRLLRFFRFVATHDCKIGQEAYNSLENLPQNLLDDLDTQIHSDKVKKVISNERITIECNKLFNANNIISIVHSLRLMNKFLILETLFSANFNDTFFDRFQSAMVNVKNIFDINEDNFSSFILCIYFLHPDNLTLQTLKVNPLISKRILELLKQSAIILRIGEQLKDKKSLAIDDISVLRHMLKDDFEYLIIVYLSINDVPLTDIKKTLKLKYKVFPISARDIIDTGRTGGDISIAIKRLEKLWLEDTDLSRQSLLKILKEDA